MMSDRVDRKKMLSELDLAAEAVESAQKAVKDAKSTLTGAECTLSNAQTAYRKKLATVKEVLPHVPDEPVGRPVSV